MYPEPFTLFPLPFTIYPFPFTLNHLPLTLHPLPSPLLLNLEFGVIFAVETASKIILNAYHPAK
jgi:hypothetical protein